MNGAFDRLVGIANIGRSATSRQLLVRVAVPAMAIVGVGAIAAILLGLQCGGLDKCFAGRAPIAAAVPVAATVADLPIAEASVVPVTEVAIRTPEVPEGVQRARRVDEMIGDTFVALASEDEGWLAGAVANAANDAETYAEGDGAGPPVPQDEETAADAAIAVATGETPVQPLERPTPLDMAAFAEEPTETAANVKADAVRKLAEVAKSQPAAEPEPTAKPEPKAEPQPQAEPEPAKPAPASETAAATDDSTRHVAGAGVNVRSGPGKSNGRVFGLAGGAKVTVTENQRGWLKITDEQGRSGWVYKDYLS